MVSDFEKKGLHPNDALLLLTANGRSLSDNIRYFRHICHAPLTIGTFLVSAGAAVITPQRRFTRAPQGSPQVFRRPGGRIFKPPCSHRAPKCHLRVPGLR